MLIILNNLIKINLHHSSILTILIFLIFVLLYLQLEHFDSLNYLFPYY